MAQLEEHLNGIQKVRGSNPLVSTKPNKGQRKSAALGMPWSVADYRLRQDILWRLIVALGQDRCFRCELAMDRDTFSVDHRLPWYPDKPELFWDQSNIFFSHVACNTKEGSDRKQKRAPDGFAWCANCKDVRPRVDFHRNATRWNGFQSECISCRERHPGRRAYKRPSPLV